MDNIQMIEVEKIHNHPDNPRKDVGDVTELAESIKKQGIMQNLTVVPFVSKFNPTFKTVGHYTVIIGHRRLAAAIQAGLKEVPCVVADMSEKEQLATMLSENMQRVDLTPVEEALGVQMLLDLGDSIKDVSKLTGFSESKVRSRAKMSQLPREDFLKSKGASIQDYIKITEVEDEGKKKSLLKKLGTADFNLEYNRAIKEQKAEQKKARWIELMESFADRITTTTGKKYVTCIYPDSSDADSFQIPKDADDVRYYYEYTQWYIRLYKEYTDEEKEVISEENKKRVERERANDAARRRLERLKTEFKELRHDFIGSYNGDKSHAYSIVDFFINYFFDGNYGYTSSEELFNFFLGYETDYKDLRKTTEYQRLIMTKPQKVLLCVVAAQVESEMRNSWNWDLTYYESKPAMKYFKLLERCGYEMAEEERAFYEGTHEAYRKGDEDDE